MKGRWITLAEVKKTWGSSLERRDELNKCLFLEVQAINIQVKDIGVSGKG